MARPKDASRRHERRQQRAKARRALHAAFRCALVAVLVCTMMLPLGVASADTGEGDVQRSGRATDLAPLTLASPQNSETWGPFTDETGTWNFTVIKVDGKTYASISGCVDTSQHTQMTIPQQVAGQVIIDGKPQFSPLDVAAIGDEAFKGDSSLESISLPTSVISVGASAFAECKYLTSADFGHAEKLEAIPASCFEGCERLSAAYIPACVETIGDSAFFNCENLATISIGNPSNLKTIGEYAFQGCKALTSIALPFYVDSVGFQAFHNCTALKTLTFGNQSMSAIGIGAFSNCTSLEELYLPDSIGSLGASAFNNCTKLKLVAFGKNLPTTIVENAFKDCPIELVIFPDGSGNLRKLKENGVLTDETPYLTTAFDSGVSPESTGVRITSISTGTGQASITIPATIRKHAIVAINDEAAKDQTGLTGVTLPAGSNFTSIGNYAFSGCTALESITIPAAVTTLGEGAFMNCSSLWDIEFKTTGLTEIPSRAFYFCGRGSNQVDLKIPEGVTTIKTDAFLGFGNDNATSFGPFPKITLPNSLKTIEKDAFNWSFPCQVRMPDAYDANGLAFGDMFYGHPGKYYFLYKPSQTTYQVTFGSWSEDWVDDLIASGIFDDGVKEYVPVALPTADKWTVTNPDYTGEQVLPTLSATRMIKDLELGTHYTVAPAEGDDCTSPGLHHAVVTGVKPCFESDSSVTLEYTIGNPSLSGDNVKMDYGPFIWDAEPYPGVNDEAPKFTIELAGKSVDLVEGVDYTLEYSDDKTGPCTVTVTLTAVDGGLYTGEQEFTYVIDKAPLESAQVVVESQVYTGESIEPKPRVAQLPDRAGSYPDELKLVENKDYTIRRYENNVNVGTARMVMAATDVCITGTKTVEFEITPLDISGGGCTVVIPYSVYAEGKDYEPHPSSVTVTTSGGKELELAEGTDYMCVGWEHEGENRFGYVTIEGRGNFKGQCRTRFEIISDGDLARASVGQIPDQVFTGGPLEPDMVVRLYDVDLLGRRDVDYTAEFVDNVDVGTASVTLTGIEEITGTLKTTFEIVPADIADAVVVAPDQVYAGSALEPAPTVTWNEMLLLEGKDFEVVGYADNVHAGTATVTVKGKGNFKGFASGTFEIGKRPVAVTADSAERVYDGTPLRADGVSAAELCAGDRVASAAVEGSQTEVGSSPNVASGARIENAAGDDVTGDYAITYSPGMLTVTPRDAVITVDDASKAHGEADPAFSGSVEGLVAEGDLGAIRYVRVGGDEDVGTYADVLTAEYTANPNYAVSVARGDFTIKAVYDVVWLDGDGSVLDRAVWIEGDVEPSTGKVPTKKEDARHTYAFAGWDEGAWDAAHAVKTYTPRFDAKAKAGVYRAVSGAGGTWKPGSDEPLTFVFKRTVDDETTFGHFAGVKMDGAAVPEKGPSGRVNWTAKSGSVILALQPAYLETLSEGKHTVTALFDDAEGGAAAEFTVAAKAGPTPGPSPAKPASSASGASAGTSPKTGDPLAWAVVPLAAAAACALALSLFARSQQAAARSGRR